MFNRTTHLLRHHQKQFLTLCFGLFLPWSAFAGYFQWDTVTLPASSGAACGDGSPYRFFVNRTPFTTNTTVFFEPGGACWDQDSCLGNGRLAASNPSGVGENYMYSSTYGIAENLSPLTARLHLDQLTPQSWNMVYLPYCTGDAHAGNRVLAYADVDPSHPRVQYHKGFVNTKVAMQWLKAHMPKPNRLLVAGQSAGSIGATANYPQVRNSLSPRKSYLLADSGPLPVAHTGDTMKQAPSIGLYNKIRPTWGLDTPGTGLVSTELSALTGFDPQNMGSLYQALARTYPADRFGFMGFQMDETIPNFAYTQFHPEVQQLTDEKARTQLRSKIYQIDLARMRTELSANANTGYWMPFWRDLMGAHVLTVLELSGGGIEELGYRDSKAFIETTLNDNAPMLRAYENDHFWDYLRPRSLLQTLVGLLGLIGVNL